MNGQNLDMNEQNPEAGAGELASPAYKDRSAGLTVFGILTILLGAMAGLLFLLMIGQAVAPNTAAPATPAWPIVVAALVYLFVAVALIWLGIGSIQARRWARALMLIFSWSWLVVGVITIISMAFLMPKILASASAASNTNQQLPPSALAVAFVVMGLVFGVLFFIMPVIWTVFYQSRHVKATCEARDTTPRWTDACPLPVLALCLWLALWVPALLVMPLTGHALIPFFGTFLTGLPAALGLLVMAAVCVGAVWLLYKLDTRGWWLALIAMVLYWVSVLITYSRHDISEMYQLMGYTSAQLEQVQKFGSVTGSAVWFSSFCMVPFIAYILFLKKYMRSKA